MIHCRKKVNFKTDRKKILAFEMYCYRRILHLSWIHKVTNVEVRKRLNVNEDLMQAVMKRKLGLFGHICRMDNSRKIKCDDGDSGRKRQARKTKQRMAG